MIRALILAAFMTAVPAGVASASNAGTVRFAGLEVNFADDFRPREFAIARQTVTVFRHLEGFKAINPDALKKQAGECAKSSSELIFCPTGEYFAFALEQELREQLGDGSRQDRPVLVQFLAEDFDQLVAAYGAFNQQGDVQGVSGSAQVIDAETGELVTKLKIRKFTRTVSRNRQSLVDVAAEEIAQTVARELKKSQ